MTDQAPYSIGKPNQKWGDDEYQQWYQKQTIKRSYQDQVLSKLEPLKERFKLEQYAALTYNPERYPLFAVTNRYTQPGKPTALITGGVHGYETSGVQGAIRFIETELEHYSDRFNLVVIPCVSPWSYETINRWNPQGIDPNRSFTPDGQSQESQALMKYVQSLNTNIDLHIDLHETTDSDNTEFRPALSARDNVEHPFWDIPDGFYLVGDTENPCNEFQSHIIRAVAQVTHIAPADDGGRIIGELSSQAGVINYPTKALGLCTGFSNARYNTTTEVYPDSPSVDDENCISAQVAAVCSGLDYVKATL